MTKPSSKRFCRTGRHAMALGLLVLLAACSKVTPENYQKIEAGMSREQVYAILGQPDEVSGGGVGNLTVGAEQWAGGNHVISVNFAGDKVVLKSIDEPGSE